MHIETEVKYGIKNQYAADLFLKSNEIGPFLISLGRWVEFEDTFLDTESFGLFSDGCYLRCRKEKGVSEYVWTLKKKSKVSKNKHIRKEYIEKTNSDSILSLKGTEIENVLKEILNSEMKVVLEMSQKRYFRDIINEGEKVAALSVDYVKCDDFSFEEAEIEFVSDNKKDLKKLLKEIGEKIENDSFLKEGLEIEKASKYEKCLENKLKENDNPDSFLSLEEKIILKNIVNSKDIDKTNIEKTNIEKTNIDKTNIDRTDIEKTNIEKTNVDKTNIEKTNIEKTNIEKTNVDKTNIEKTDVDQTNIEKTNIDKTDVEKTNIDKTNIDKTDVEKTDVEKTNIDKTNIDKTDIDKTDIGKTDVEKTNIEKTDIDKTDIGKTDVDKTETSKCCSTIIRKSDILLKLDSGENLESVSNFFNISPGFIKNIKNDFLKYGTSIFPIVNCIDSGFKPFHDFHTYSKKENENIKSTFDEIVEMYGVTANHKKDIIENISKIYDGFSPLLLLNDSENKLLLKKAYEISNIEQRFLSKCALQFTKEIFLIHAPEDLSQKDFLKIEIIFEILNSLDFKKYGKKSELKKKEYVHKTIKKILKRKCAQIHLSPKEQTDIINLSAVFEISQYLKENLYDVNEISVTENLIEISYTTNEYGAEEFNSEINEYKMNEYKINEYEIKNYEIYESPLINEVFSIPIKIKKSDKTTDEILDLKDKDFAKIKPDDYIETAASKILLNQIEIVLNKYETASKGEDPDAVHDMRVAIRKIRGVFTVFHDYLNEDWTKKYSDGFRRIVSSTGFVRDLDVLKENTINYTNEEESDESTQEFFELLQIKKDSEILKMQQVLHAKEYQDIIHDFKKDLENGKYIGRYVRNKKGDVFASRIKDVIPIIISKRASNITAYNEWLFGKEVNLNTFHRLRIECKNMRYTLEFFNDIVGPVGKEMENDFKTLQTILGDIQDISVGNLIIKDMKTENKEDMKNLQTFTEKIQNDKKQDIEELMNKFFEIWDKIDENYMNEKIYEIIKYMNSI